MDQYQQAAAQLMGAVGAADVQAFYPGVAGADVRAFYPGGGVGNPAMQVPNTQGQPVNYAPTHYVAGDVSYFGLGRTTVPANDTLVIELRPSRPFKPQKLFLPSTVQNLLLTSADIGGTNMFANNGGVPVEIFSEVSTSPQIDWLTIEPAVGIAISVQNPTGGPLIFSGALYGTQVRR